MLNNILVGSEEAQMSAGIGLLTCYSVEEKREKEKGETEKRLVEELKANNHQKHSKQNGHRILSDTPMHHIRYASRR